VGDRERILRHLEILDLAIKPGRDTLQQHPGRVIVAVRLTLSFSSCLAGFGRIRRFKHRLVVVVSECDETTRSVCVTKRHGVCVWVSE
jgi:hypothetical protein